MTNLYLKKRNLLALIRDKKFVLTGSFTNLIYNRSYGRLPNDIDLSVANRSDYKDIRETIIHSHAYKIVDELNIGETSRLILSSGNKSFSVEATIEDIPFRTSILPSIFGFDSSFLLKSIDFDLYIAAKLYTYFLTIAENNFGDQKLILNENVEFVRKLIRSLF